MTEVTVVASSEFSADYAITNIQSDQITNPWHTGGEGSDALQWITFEFAQNVVVSGIRYKMPEEWDLSAMNNFYFEYSLDGQTYTRFHTGQGVNHDCCAWEEVTFQQSSLFTKYFRLYMVDTHGYAAFTFTDIELKICSEGTRISSNRNLVVLLR